MRLLNYKKDGTPFWNMFTVAPMADIDGQNRFFIGIQVPLLSSCSFLFQPPTPQFSHGECFGLLISALLQLPRLSPHLLLPQWSTDNPVYHDEMFLDSRSARKSDYH